MSQRAKVEAKPLQRATAPTADSHRWVAPAGLFLILLTTFLVYLPALNGARLWDDEAHITKPELQSTRGLYRIWFELGATQQYYPLLHTAFWIEHKLWGDSVRGYHLVNLLWHMTSVVLFYSILRRLKIPGAMLAAAIFAMHPVMVESVAWISEQKNALSAAFYLSAMRVYLEFDESRRRGPYLLALGLFLLGLFTKTVTATLPAALLVIFWWQRGRLCWKRDVLPLVPFFALGAAAGLVTAWIERTLIGAQGDDFNFSFLERCLVAGRVVWFYLGKLLWPDNLMFIYPRWKVDAGEGGQWIFPVGVLGVTVGLLLNRPSTSSGPDGKRGRGPLVGWLLFVGTLFPVLGFLNVFPFTFSFVADHFQYLASLGIISLVAAGIALLVRRLAAPARYVGVAMCLVVLGTLATLASQQNAMYADAVTLYQTTIDRNPECWMALDNLGEELAARGKLEEAIELYRLALRIRPNFAQAENSLGFALTRLDRPTEGVEHIEQAIRLRPDFTGAHLNLATAFSKLGRNDEAVEHIKFVLKAEPDNAEAHSNYGNLLIRTGDPQNGIKELRLALAQKPEDPFLLNNLGIALMRNGRTSEAIELLEHAVRQKADYYQARNSLGLALAGIGKGPQAIEQFSNALTTNPNYANAHVNLANVLVSTGDMTNAIAHYQRAVEIRPESTEAQYKLALALTQTGKPGQAIEHYEAAIRSKADDLQSYASLAQTLAVLNRSQEAVAAAKKGIEIARSAGKQDELKQFESWLKEYTTKPNGDGGAKSLSVPPSSTK
jgi:tetratricopeptide (TPR) repeat protein